MEIDFAANTYCWNTSLIYFLINFYKHLWMQFDFHEIIQQLALVSISISIYLPLCLILVSPQQSKMMSKERNKDVTADMRLIIWILLKLAFRQEGHIWQIWESFGKRWGFTLCLKWSFCYLSPGVLRSWNGQAFRECARFVFWKSQTHLETYQSCLPTSQALRPSLSSVGIFFFIHPEQVKVTEGN